MITTHVLDLARGRPAAGMTVSLERSLGAADWQTIGHGVTDADGRLRDLGTDDTALPAGVYRLVFETGRYFHEHDVATFYPRVVILFETAAGGGHYHVPLLVSPYGYSTYRGS